MINFRLEIASPWSWDYFRNLGCLHGQISKNKFWELEHTYYSNQLLDVEFKFATKGDHAGLEFVLGVLGYGIAFRIYDNRHWDSELNSWYTYDENGNVIIDKNLNKPI
jgi:hypothetical protein